MQTDLEMIPGRVRQRLSPLEGGELSYDMY